MLQPLKSTKHDRDTLSYLQSILPQLVAMSASTQFGFLTHLLEMAMIEASDQVKEHRIHEGDKIPTAAAQHRKAG